jgi:DNA-binding PadR family transcriptional regulator
MSTGFRQSNRQALLGLGYNVMRYIALRYSGTRCMVGELALAAARREDDVGYRLDRWADPPLLVLASLAEEPKHGYAIIQDVADTMGVRLSAGTLYAVIARLESRGLIEPLEADDRRRPYRITAAGAKALAEQSERMSRVASLARQRLVGQEASSAQRRLVGQEASSATDRLGWVGA